MSKRAPAAFPRTAVLLAYAAVLFHATARSLEMVAHAVAVAIHATARSLESVSAVAEAGGVVPPPVPTDAKKTAKV